MQFKIDLKIFLFFILFYFTGQIESYAVILFFAFIHELGHLLAGWAVGMKPNGIKIKPYGVSISFKILPQDYNNKILKGNILEVKKILVALAGPLTNLIIIFIIMNCKVNMFKILMIIYSNILLVIFNLIPIYPLDGGRIFKSLIYIVFGKRKAETYTQNVSLVILIIISFIGSIAIFYMHNISIFLIVIFLWIIYIKEDTIYRNKAKIYNLIEKTIENENN